MTLIKFVNDYTKIWYRISKDDIVDSFHNCELRILSKENIKKYNIKAGDSLKKFEDDEELADEFNDVLEDSDYVDTFLDDMIDLSDIDKESIYFDRYNDEFFSGEDILFWDTQKYYYYYDGSNWNMKEISEIEDIEVEYIGSENYNTGSYEKYRLKNGKHFTIDSSMYQGTIDNVVEDYNYIIEEL